MHLARTFVATLSIALVLVVAALAAASLSSGMFGFDAWPTAPEAAARERVVQIDGPVSATPRVRADARTTPGQAERQAGDLIAEVPRPAAPQRPAAGSRPVARGTDPQAPPARDPAPASEPAAVLVPVATPGPLAPGELPGTEPLLPTKQLPDLPGELSYEPAPSWMDPQLTRRPPRGGHGDGRD